MERPPLSLSVTLQKETTSIDDSIAMEKESPVLRNIMENARQLRNIPERRRLRELLYMLRSNVEYSHDHVLSELKKNNNEVSEAIQENNASPIISAESLREAMRLGYANCNVFSISMLILGKEAGLEGGFLTNGPHMGNKEGDDPSPIKNIFRRDTKQNLFKRYNSGENIPEGHAWVEFRMSDGTWIPVDPATETVGDTTEGLDLFREANYKASVNLKVESYPSADTVKHSGTRDLEFFPGETRHTGVLQVYPQNSEKIKISTFQLPPKFALGLNFTIASVKS